MLNEFEFFFNQTKDLTCIANAEGYFDIINTQLSKLLGCTEKELLENQFLNFVHPEDIEATLKEVEKLESGALTINFKNRYRKKNGDYIWFEWSSTPDPITGKLYAIARDITNRKKDEEKFRIVVESVPYAIVLVNSKGEIVMIHNQTVVHFGYSEEELIGENLSILIPKAYKTNHSKQFETFFLNPTKRPMGGGQSFNVLRKDGSEFPADIGLNLIESDEEVLVLASIMDISERKGYEKALKYNSDKIKAKNIKLKELNATKDKLFSIIGHDLKGPIGRFKNLVELMISDFDLTNTEKLSNTLKIIQKTASTSYDLLENLLLWAKTQQNEIIFSPSPNNLFEISTKCIHLLQGLANQKRLNLINTIPKDTTMYADINMVTTVIRNLISNTIKFSHENTNIIISSNKIDDFWVISVKDEGVGINEDGLTKIFDKNLIYSNYGTNKEKGSGLGLILCKEFIEIHNGKIWVDSKLEEGSEFKFSLPVNQN
jgi:PAS domain S-box-containing protein